MCKALDVANYIVNTIPVDNLKLQKLLYYSQAVHMVLNKSFDEPLFLEDIEAWTYGPVVPSVYRKYKSNGFNTIPAKGLKCSLNPNEIKTIDIVLSYYGSMSGVELVSKTHQEEPWRSVYDEHKKNNIITKRSIFNYFNSCLSFSENETN